ncbi:MAG TPA: MerR family transcriptional regulator [Bacteroidota bacterium]|nr:MerR family transcriptional regulator [Bacteroidota bacterium]
MYEREGLIISHKSKSNHRRYSPNDVERIKCIRRAINELKFGIAGIKGVYALIPCWSIVKCSAEDRQNCDASKGHTKPCWSHRHTSNTCSRRVCRECPVYQKLTDCSQVKQSILWASQDTTHSIPHP